MQPIYALDINAEKCNFEVMVNGFPAMKLRSQFLTNHAATINQYLIGDGNVCDVVITPAGADIATLKNPHDAIALIKFSGSVKQYDIHDVSCPEGGRVLQKFNFDRKVAGSFHFTNEVHNFSQLLLHGDKIEHMDKVMEYAVHLFNLSQKNDMEAFAAEFMPKMKDYAKAAFQQEASLLEDFKAFLEYEFFRFPDKKHAPTNDKMYTRPLCHHRIIEVGLLPDLPLLHRDADDEGEEDYMIPIYVGMIDKQLKVVR